MKDKVVIKVEKGKYDESHRGGSEFVSVGYSGRIYGAGSPCDNEEETSRAIRRAEQRIREEGDIPTVEYLDGLEPVVEGTLKKWF